MDEEFAEVAVGKEHVAALTKDGKLFTMGTINHGQLGHDVKEKSAEEIEQERLRYKKAGYKPGAHERSKPEIGFVGGDLAGKKIISIGCGEHHTVAVTDEGDVYSWGKGRNGALGHKDNMD